MKRSIYRTLSGLVALAACLIFAAPALAVHPDSKSEIENLRQRIEALEAEGAPPQEPFHLEALGKHLHIGGLLELEAFFQKVEGADESGDLALATAELDFEVEINDNIGGHIILLHEEGGPDLEVDEAAITLTHPLDALGGELSLSGGRLYLPFGKFNSSFITDPLTLDLGETNNTTVKLGWVGNGVELSLGTFSGETDTAGDNDVIDSWVAAIDIAAAENLSFGASYISDIAESDIGLVTDAALYTSSVAGASAYVSATLGSFTLDAEYLTALERFDDAVVAAGEDLTGDKPGAWNVELAYSPEERWLMALRAEGTEDFQDDLTRYGAVASYGIFTNTVVALEYLLGDQDGADEDRSHTVTAQLAFEF